MLGQNAMCNKKYIWDILGFLDIHGHPGLKECLYFLKTISAYHCKCIDPWLTKRKKTCPVCKRKVIPGANPDSDSESSDEEGPSTSERTPLLAGNNNHTRRSTFDNSGNMSLFFISLKRDWNSFEASKKWNL